jgi:hypothetical protein
VSISFFKEIVEDLCLVDVLARNPVVKSPWKYGFEDGGRGWTDLGAAPIDFKRLLCLNAVYCRQAKGLKNRKKRAFLRKKNQFITDLFDFLMEEFLKEKRRSSLGQVVVSSNWHIWMRRVIFD